MQPIQKQLAAYPSLQLIRTVFASVSKIIKFNINTGFNNICQMLLIANSTKLQSKHKILIYHQALRGPTSLRSDR